MKTFQKNLMQSEDVKALLGTGIFYKNGAKAECADGALVAVGELEDHSIYAGMKDVNVRKITLPTAETKEYAIVDYAGRSEGEINGVLYREGIKTAGLSVPAGALTRYRYIKKGDTFYLGTHNFAGAPAIGKYGVPTANEDTWTIGEEAAESGLCIKIEATKPLTEGTVDTDTLYFCKVVSE